MPPETNDKPLNTTLIWFGRTVVRFIFDVIPVVAWFIYSFKLTQIELHLSTGKVALEKYDENADFIK